jgi:hypothetical protein
LDLLYDRDFLFFGVKGTTYYVISLAFIQVRLRGSWIARGVKSLIFQWGNESQLAVDPEITLRCWRSWSRTVCMYTDTTCRVVASPNWSYAFESFWRGRETLDGMTDPTLEKSFWTNPLDFWRSSL